MNKIDNTNPLDILKYIIKHDKIKQVEFVVMITGKVGPTGKTWLCNELLKLGYRAMEMSPTIHNLMLKDDDTNHVIVDEDTKQVIVVLNEILPMYWNKWFKKSNFNPDGIYMFRSRREAQDVLYKLYRIADEYGAVTRGDFMNLVNITSHREDCKRGWFPDTIRKARVVSHSLGYFIEFPRSMIIV